jgi:site-specific DNA-methyltransferase (adenine-specific)
MSRQEESIIEILTNDTPFGIASNFSAYRLKKEKNDVPLFFSKSGKRDIGYVDGSTISKNVKLIDKWKVLVPGARGIQKPPDLVIGKPWLCPPPAVCTQTFLAFFVDTKAEAESLDSYLRTKFFRFLVSLRKITQNGFRSTYSFVPQQSWDREWTDEALFKKYKLTQEEIEFIESMIRPMELEDA